MTAIQAYRKQSVCMCDSPSPPVPTVHSINFKFGEGITEDPRECSVECEYGGMNSSEEPAPNGTCCDRTFANGHCTSLYNKEDRNYHIVSLTTLVMKSFLKRINIFFFYLLPPSTLYYLKESFYWFGRPVFAFTVNVELFFVIYVSKWRSVP